MATETSVLTGLESLALWGHFETLTRIARPSQTVGDHTSAGPATPTTTTP
jgi:hypothetical protein